MVASVTGFSWSVQMTISRKLPSTIPGASGLVVWMSAMVPESIGRPVAGSVYVEPRGSTMNWPTAPWPQPWMPSTWSCQKMLSRSASAYQRYRMNSMPAPSPAACACLSGRSSVIVLVDGSMLTIDTASIAFSPNPTPNATPGLYFWSTRSTTTDVSPTAAGAARRVSSIVYGRIECSKLKPTEVPSDPCGSNCTWWMCISTLAKLPNVSSSFSSEVRVTLAQSPTLARMASG